VSEGKSVPESAPNPHDIHRVIREEGEEQLSRHLGAVAWSGLGAGLSMGFSFLTMALLQARLPIDAPWRPLVSSFGYTLGFLIVILGRQQLFTETTLTPVLPLLSNFSVARLGQLFRFWAVVLVANLAGTWLFALAIAHENFFAPPVWRALESIADEALQAPFAPMVWLLPSAGSAKTLIIFVLTYVVAMAQFSHVIAGSCEAAFAVLTGSHTLGEYFTVFLGPTLLGNTIGGVALVALLNHAPLATER